MLLDLFNLIKSVDLNYILFYITALLLALVLLSKVSRYSKFKRINRLAVEAWGVKNIQEKNEILSDIFFQNIVTNCHDTLDTIFHENLNNLIVRHKKRKRRRSWRLNGFYSFEYRKLVCPVSRQHNFKSFKDQFQI